MISNIHDLLVVVVLASYPGPSRGGGERGLCMCVHEWVSYYYCACAYYGIVCVHECILNYVPL